jgi:hypothetical protein
MLNPSMVKYQIEDHSPFGRGVRLMSAFFAIHALPSKRSAVDEIFPYLEQETCGHRRANASGQQPSSAELEQEQNGPTRVGM